MAELRLHFPYSGDERPEILLSAYVKYCVLLLLILCMIRRLYFIRLFLLLAQYYCKILIFINIYIIITQKILNFPSFMHIPTNHI